MKLMKTIYEAMALVVIVVLVFLQGWASPRSFRSSRFRCRWGRAPSRSTAASAFSINRFDVRSRCSRSASSSMTPSWRSINPSRGSTWMSCVTSS